MICLPEAFQEICTGSAGPAAKVTLPVPTRLEIFSMAAAPPTALTYLSKTSLALGKANAGAGAGFNGGVAAAAGGGGANSSRASSAVVSATIGMLTGLLAPR